MTLTIIITACMAVLIYRLGLSDGQSAAKGERIKSTVTVRRKDTAEEERLKKGLKGIMDFGMEGK